MLHRRIQLFFPFILCLILSGQAMATSSFYNGKHLEVALRMIGHQVLLDAGDSTSLVLPVESIENEHTIRFDTEFSFNPDDLKNTVDSILFSAGISTSYILEVLQCDSNEVVYSYEVKEESESDIIPCRSRDQPSACYSILLYFPPTEAESKQPFLVYFTVIAIALLLAGILIFRKKSKRSKARDHLIKLGRYHFDKHNSMLILQEQKTELTSKEADLLLLLFQSVNQTVERDIILQEVWGDEGDYIGRTLDVFISKLRKKLDADPGIRIVNARGVGYKLVVEL